LNGLIAATTHGLTSRHDQAGTVSCPGGAVDLPGHGGVVAEDAGTLGYVERPGWRDRFSDIDRLANCELFGAQVDGRRGSPQNLPALERIHAGPRTALEGLPRRRHGLIHVARGPLGDGRRDRFRRPIDVIARPSALRIAKAAVDEESVLA